jgi:hypothetical protein
MNYSREVRFIIAERIKRGNTGTKSLTAAGLHVKFLLRFREDVLTVLFSTKSSEGATLRRGE